MMTRAECLKKLAAHRTNEIVVAVYQSAFEWEVISPSDLNYYAVEAMGQASSHGLGLALAFPDRRIIVLDGDGALLMNLGCLVTIANVAPRNLTHIVCNNAVYETTGGQPTPGSTRSSYAAIARGAGYPVVHEFDDLEEFGQAVPRLISANGPVFVDLKAPRGPEQYPEDFTLLNSAKHREAFKRAVLSSFQNHRDA